MNARFYFSMSFIWIIVGSIFWLGGWGWGFLVVGFAVGFSFMFTHAFALGVRIGSDWLLSPNISSSLGPRSLWNTLPEYTAVVDPQNLDKKTRVCKESWLIPLGGGYSEDLNLGVPAGRERGFLIAPKDLTFEFFGLVIVFAYCVPMGPQHRSLRAAQNQSKPLEEDKRHLLPSTWWHVIRNTKGWRANSPIYWASEPCQPIIDPTKPQLLFHGFPPVALADLYIAVYNESLRKNELVKLGTRFKRGSQILDARPGMQIAYNADLQGARDALGAMETMKDATILSLQRDVRGLATVNEALGPEGGLLSWARETVAGPEESPQRGA